jgi:poly(3-hydroxybutyrate) depolymerase
MRRGILQICLGAFCLWAGVVSACGANAPVAPVAQALPGKAGIFPDEKITVGAEVREYRLIVPDSLDLSKPVPIVFAFHGMGEDNKDHFATVSTLPALAAEHKFILVFPAAATQAIQGQLIKAWALVPDRAVSDILFFDALLAKLQTQYHIDPDAIYLTGMSNGAYFAHLLARERADVIAAVAAHSGELGQFDLPFIQSKRKFPVMIIHGDADPVFNVSLARSARATYEAAGHAVTYLEISGWGHVWDPRVEEKIWDFFSQNRLHPGLVAAPLPAAATSTASAASASTPAPAAHS